MVDQLLAKYGPKRSAWPKKLLRNLGERNAALIAAIMERVGFVPKEVFWPLGLAARDLVTNKAGECLMALQGRAGAGTRDGGFA